jgi:hypothetical protein
VEFFTAMDSFCIPWACLDSTSKPVNQEKLKPKPQKSFAQAFTNVCDIPLSQLPQACVKGDNLAIPIPEKEYTAGIKACKHNLQGRIIWPKGATPLTVAALKNKLAPIWKDLSKWGVSSLGKGFYEFCFSSLEDVRRVRSVASWALNPGSLKLFARTKDFIPRVQHNLSAQVWVRFYGLSQEYWCPNILFAIASSIGTLICIDAITAKPMMERTFGQFVRVLVDMDLSQTLRDKVLVERKGFAFFVELDYENLPDFCSNCKILGHNMHNCKKLISLEEEKQDKHFKDKRQPQKMYVQSNDGRAGKGKNIEVSEKDDTIVTKDDDAAKKIHNEKIDEVIVIEEQSNGGNTTVSRHQKIDKPQGSASESNNSQKMGQAQISASEGFKSQKNDQP